MPYFQGNSDWKYDSRIIYGITTANSSYSGRSLNFKTFSNEDDTVSSLCIIIFMEELSLCMIFQKC